MILDKGYYSLWFQVLLALLLLWYNTAHSLPINFNTLISKSFIELFFPLAIYV